LDALHWYPCNLRGGFDLIPTPALTTEYVIDTTLC